MKLFSISSKISCQDNIKIIRIHKNTNSHSNLQTIRGQQRKNVKNNNTNNNNNLQLNNEFFIQNDDITLKKHQMSKNEKYITYDNDNKTLLITLKNQLKQLEKDYIEKLNQVDQYKKMLSITRYEEMQVEIYNYQQQILLYQKENQDLLQKIKQTESYRIEDLYSLQDQTLQQLYKKNHDLQVENVQLKAENNFLNNQNDQLHFSINQRDREIKILQNNIKKLQEQIDSQDNKMKTRQQIYKESVENAQLQEKVFQLQYQLEFEINNKNSEIQVLKEKLNELEIQKTQLMEKLFNNTLDKRNSLIEQPKIESRQESSRKLRLSLNNSGVSYNQQQQQQSYLIHQSSQIKKSTEMSKTYNQDCLQEEFGSFSDSDIQQDQKIEIKKLSQKKIIKVNFYDVQKFGYEIKFKLLSKEVSIEQVEDLFFKYDQQIKIHDLLDIFLQEPFKIQSYEDRKLIARYLVEDNAEDYIIYNALKSNDINIVLSVLKKLIGKYQLFSTLEIKKIENDLRIIFERAQFLINDAIQQLIIKKKNLKQGQCEKQDYEQALNFAEANLTSRQLEYIYFLNYTFFQELQLIYYQNIMTYFIKIQ